MAYEDKAEFLQDYLQLCEKYGYYVGTSHPNARLMLYEIINTGKVFVQEDELYNETKLQLLEDLG